MGHPVRGFERHVIAAAVIATFVAGATWWSGREPLAAAAEDAPPKPLYDKHAPVDPVAANGEIFVDWPKPDVALVFSGEQDGYIEPCGCAGLQNQKGGLKRRHSLLKQLATKGWPVVPLDVGGLSKRFGIQTELKFDAALKALAQLGYKAVGFGSNDLRLDILSLVLNSPDAKNIFVSANVGILDFDPEYSQRFKVIEAGGLKIGVTGVMGKKEISALKNAGDLTLVDPDEALQQVIPELQKSGCDKLVLLSYAKPEETKAIAQRFPVFDFVVTAGGAEVPPRDTELIEGTKTHLIEIGDKGMYVIVVGLYKNGQPPFRYQRVPLDSRFADSPEMQKLMVDYQHDLETLGLEGLGIKPTAHPTARQFAGSEACSGCHTSAFAVWEKTPHAHATKTLEQLNPPRHFDPECLSCHVTGWEPQKYFPFISGYLGLKETPEMVANGCENCHGPAARHVAAENGEIEVDDKELEELRAALRLKIVPNEGNKDGQDFANGKVVQMCMQCHDLDNSPEFDFQLYWPHVKHSGKD
ncbi:MAG: multiheme c-type cytochrome [Pirellulales bacterium]